MNWPEIEKLLEKYFEGDTSAEEEKRLIDALSRDDTPVHLIIFREQFGYFKNQKELSYPNEAFDENIMKSIEEPRVISLFTRNPWLIWLSGVAAIALILLAVFFPFRTTNKVNDTFSDPNLAFNEATKVLLYVSAQMNKGTSKMEPIGKFESGLKELKSMVAFDEGIKEASKIEKYNKIEQNISVSN